MAKARARTAPSPIPPPSHLGLATNPNAKSESAATHPLPTTFTEKKVHRLGIPTELLRDARQTAEELAANMDGYKAGMSDARYYNRSLNSGNPAKKLILRLRLDQAAAQQVDSVLTAACEEQIKQRMEAEQTRMDRETRLLAEDRENYINYLALESMQQRGSTLSDEQKAFRDSFRGKLEPAETAPAKPISWYNNPKLLDTLNQQLPPSKSAELANYVEEQKTRDEELRIMHAQMRANQIAEQLGLNKADQSTVFDYIKESPDASNAELSAMLPYELRTLLVPHGM